MPYRLIHCDLGPPQAERTARLGALLLVFLIVAAPSRAQVPSIAEGLYLKTRVGLSDYLGDNNTIPFNQAAFAVDGKKPYSFGIEAGVQVNARWSIGFGAQSANYPVITRFFEGLNIADDPTIRDTYQLMVRYRMNERRLAPYAHFGYHLTFGDVNIYEASRLENGEVLNTQSHYMHGPLLGFGLDYALRPRLSFFVEATAHASLMDDSVDGRLPLGPPQPTNLRAVNRFGTFDLLNAFGVGLTYRPWCGAACAPGPKRRNPERAGIRMLRVSKSLQDTVLMISYQYAFAGFKRLFLGVEGGMIPRSNHVRYTFPDGQEILDNTHFTSTYLGLSARLFLFRAPVARLHPYLGFTAGAPRQAQLMAGVDVALHKALSVGVEGRLVACPTRRQDFHKHISYRMNRVCEYGSSVGLTAAFRL